MIPDTRTRALLLAMVTAAVVGLIDAATAHTWDLIAVFAMITVLGLAALVRRRGRATLTLRRDLAGWIALRAADGGEPVGRVADRAVAAYRSGLIGAPEEPQRR
ncbi:hypothetical protein [Nocardia huaxiensis]|uniref:Uncharacterized protein n=1 Tax=Nocardia huaxiensis TaxID=2755382 RepID=A0A7D6VB24_9NOCA|nr:hypothetical protein [Nocardia huaxiensis]QLY28577.1 hypothetical protein H0264_24920 [Nocardia huaxiensis]UFS97956.1 hypothetical protein LPY97_08685 [Nocardia huaxiensis]